MDRDAMRRKAGTVLVLLSPVLLLGIASAQRQDAEGSKDHPTLSRMPNFYIYQYDEKEFDRHEFQTSDRMVAIEGHYYSIVYYLQDNSPKTPSNLQIIRNFENAIRKIGGAVLWDNGDRDATLKLERQGREIWIEVSAGDGGSRYWLNTIEKEAMQQEVTANAASWSSDIANNGHAAVYGIYFDVDKAEIKPESDPALQEIAKLLQKDVQLRIYLVGHTDCTGEFVHNMKLSEARANAVMNVLLGKYGVAAARLKAYGIGSLAPVASNDTEEGRAKNRRVELVKQ